MLQWSRYVRSHDFWIHSQLTCFQTNEDVWADKVCYKITIPQTNFIFGTQATADFQLIPLRKGVTIGAIKMELHEHVVLNAIQGERNIPHSWDAIVAKEEFQMPEDAEQRMTEADEDNPFDESYKFSLTLPFPKSLKKCRQNVETDFIRIDHKIKLYVNLHNPEGHTSQVRCTLFWRDPLLTLRSSWSKTTACCSSHPTFPWATISKSPRQRLVR